MAFNKTTIATLLGVPTPAGILADLKAAVAAAGSSITNWNVGGLAREVGEMVKVGLGSLYNVVITGVSAGFWETAEGAWLSALALDRDCARKVATKTQGILIASRETPGVDVVIRVGTRIKTRVTVNGRALHFIADVETVLAAEDTSCPVAVTAAEAGLAYNVAPGTITEPVTYVAGIDAWTNSADWISIPGTDDETDDALRERGRLKWTEVSAFTIARALRSLALSHASVTYAEVLDDWIRGQGTVDVVIATPTGTPSALVIAEVQALMDDKDLLCADVLVRGPTPRSVALVGALYCAEGTDLDHATELQAGAIALANAYAGDGTSSEISRLGIGEPFVKARLVTAWMTPAGMQDAVISTPAANVFAAVDEMVELSSVAVHVYVWSSGTSTWVQVL
jgi:uncharacterized phage protein gp47/JayE